MNDSTPFDTIGDEPIEARIVSWVLGEASAFEAAELERLCEERPELLVFRHRMRALHGLLTEAESAEPDNSWKLPAEKRKVLDEIFGEEKPSRLEDDADFQIRRSGRRALLAIAACLILTIAVAGLIGPRSLISPMGLTKSLESDTTPKLKSKSNAAAELAELNKAVRDQEEKVDERRKLLTTITRTKGIIYKGQDSFYGQSGVNEDQGAQHALETYNKVEQDKAQLENQINGLLKYDNDQLMTYASGLDLPDNTIKSLYPQYKENQLKLAKLKSEGLAENHPEVVAAKEQTEAMKHQIDEGVVNLRATMQSQLAVANDRLKNVEVRRDDTREEAIRRGLDAQDYVDAKRDYESDQQRLQQLKLKQIEKSVELGAIAGGLAKNEASQAQLEGGANGGNFDRSFSDGAPIAQSAPVAPTASPAPAAPPMELAKEESEGIDIRGVDSRIRPRVVPSSPEEIPGVATDSAIAATDERDMNESVANGASDLISGRIHLTAGMTHDLRSADKVISNNSDAILDGPSGTGGGADGAAASSEFQKLEKDSQTTAGVSVGGELADLEPAMDKAVTASPAQPRAATHLRQPRPFVPPQAQTAPTETDGKKEMTQEFLPPGRTGEYLFRVPEFSKMAAPAKKTPLESMEEIAATDEPYSTFSLNINDASFQIAKAALEKGERPDPTAIKVEQFYNAVDYGDPGPASNEPVAATIEQSAHPIIPGRNLVRVALKTAAAGRSASQPLRLTLLVDQSGSMVREDRRSAMANALKQLSGLLTKNDHLTVIGFSRESHLLADNLTGDQATKLSDLVNQTASEGGTNLEQALNLGEQMAARRHLSGEQNRIVLFTDGAANLGNANPERLAERVKTMRQKGIAFDIAGIGADGVNDRLLSELARNGNGRYYVVSDEKNDSFARQLAGAFRPAAENVKVQVHFNPGRVGRYKLIGFEKDRLKTEDFRNDAVDAAELAAEEAGVAIYQVETLPQGTGEIGEVSVRFRDTSKGEMVERKWTMPFESTTPAFDRATPSMQLAGLSMLAAEKLRGGPLADAIDFKQLTGPRSLVKQFYGSSSRVADMLRVIGKLE
ncbi:MAG: von Willebrand factor type A domain-containing protein [Luteolibacter sp.]